MDRNGADFTPAAIAGQVSLARLTLTDFRCYQTLRLDVEPRPVVLTGPNGAGKTNILEALSFLVPGRGLRGARLSEVARAEPDQEPHEPIRNWAVAAQLETPAGAVSIGTGRDDQPRGAREKRLVRIDGEPVRSQALLAKWTGCLSKVRRLVGVSSTGWFLALTRLMPEGFPPMTGPCVNARACCGTASRAVAGQPTRNG